MYPCVSVCLVYQSNPLKDAIETQVLRSVPFVIQCGSMTFLDVHSILNLTATDNTSSLDFELKETCEVAQNYLPLCDSYVFFSGPSISRSEKNLKNIVCENSSTLWSSRF